MSYPRITIVTPSFNQAPFLEQTIRSVLDQNYPNLEYIIVDGGSTDGSVEIIKTYADRLAWWVSEHDSGQSEAINKGFARATGTLGNWLCSDDVLLPGALHVVAKTFEQHPQACAWYGNGINIDIDGKPIGAADAHVLRPDQLMAWIPGVTGSIFQPSCFFSVERFRSIGGLATDLHNVMDVHLWGRLLQTGSFVKIESALSGNRDYPGTKTNRSPILREIEHLAMLQRMNRNDLVLLRFDALRHLLLESMQTRSMPNEMAEACSHTVHWKTLVHALLMKLRRRLPHAPSKV